MLKHEISLVSEPPLLLHPFGAGGEPEDSTAGAITPASAAAALQGMFSIPFSRHLTTAVAFFLAAAAHWQRHLSTAELTSLRCPSQSSNKHNGIRYK